LQKTQKSKAFANQIMMTFFWRHFCAIGHFFSADMLLLLSKSYKKPATEFSPHYCFRSFPGTLYDGKHIIRAEGKAKFAMVAMIIPLLSTLY
jgi:Na+-driven multidrug efflux pump